MNGRNKENARKEEKKGKEKKVNKVFLFCFFSL